MCWICRRLHPKKKEEYVTPDYIKNMSDDFNCPMPYPHLLDKELNKEYLKKYAPWVLDDYRDE